MIDYIAAVDEHVAKETAEKIALYQEKAIAGKPRLLEAYQNQFPMLWETCAQKFQDAPSVFLNIGSPDIALSGFASPGVLIDGLIFSVYRNSYCNSFYVGVYNGLDPIVHGGQVLSEGVDHDKKLATLLKKLLPLVEQKTIISGEENHGS